MADEAGYRYQPFHPDTRHPWPEFPPDVLEAWHALTGWTAPPEAGLINWYGPEARMGLHQDRDEQDFTAPVLSLSLGDTAIFRFGGDTRRAPTRSIRLASGDALLIGGDSRLAFHGIDRILPGTSTLMGQPGRFNLTLRGSPSVTLKKLIRRIAPSRLRPDLNARPNRTLTTGSSLCASRSPSSPR